MTACRRRPVTRVTGMVVEVVARGSFLLPAVGVEVLAEVALAVEQADADQRQAEVAGALQVVAGEDAEAAGVDRQAFVEAELGGEVGDRNVAAVVGVLGELFVEPGFAGFIDVEAVEDAVQVGDVGVVGGDCSRRLPLSRESI